MVDYYCLYISSEFSWVLPVMICRIYFSIPELVVKVVIVSRYTIKRMHRTPTMREIRNTKPLSKYCKFISEREHNRTQPFHNGWYERRKSLDVNRVATRRRLTV